MSENRRRESDQMQESDLNSGSDSDVATHIRNAMAWISRVEDSLVEDNDPRAIGDLARASGALAAALKQTSAGGENPAVDLNHEEEPMRASGEKPCSGERGNPCVTESRPDAQPISTHLVSEPRSGTARPLADRDPLGVCPPSSAPDGSVDLERDLRLARVAIKGHRDRAFFDHDNATSDGDRREAVGRIAAIAEVERVLNLIGKDGDRLAKARS